MKTIEINMETFELGKPIERGDIGMISRETIDDAYGRPSEIKRRIFNEWYYWFIHNNGHCGVSSHNCMMFTLEGIVIDKETNKEYYCYITKSHNKAYEII